MIVAVMVMMMAVGMGPSMHKCPPALVEQPAPDEYDRHARKNSQDWNDLFRDDVTRQQQRAEAQQKDADSVREGDSRAEQGGMLHVAARSDQVRGDDGLTVTGLESVHRTQPECDGDSGYQPSGAQLRLVQ